MKKKIVIIEGHRPSLMTHDDFKVEREVLKDDCDINHFSNFGVREANDALPNADIVVVRPGQTFDASYVNLLDKCKAIISIGMGYEHIDVDCAKNKGIPVSNIPDYGTEEVSDTAVTMILAHLRKINIFSHLVKKSGNFDWDWRIHTPQKRFSDIKVGIIGLGRIGTSVALRLKALKFKVSFYDKYLPRGMEKAVDVKRYLTVSDLLKEVDVVSIHVPAATDTIGMIDEEFLNNLKKESVLINVSRGSLFKNMEIIYNRLKANSTFRVGCDVWDEEPPKKSPLIDSWINGDDWLADRLIVTPHSSFYSESSVYELRRFCADLVWHVLEGREPYNRVN